MSLSTLPIQAGEQEPNLPLMRSAFRTTVSCGPEGRYEMRFIFRSLDDLHEADREWCAVLAHPVVATAHLFDELVAFSESAEIKPTFADAVRIALAAKQRAGVVATAQQPTLREDAMYAMGYQRGVKAGWNLCIADDHAGYARTQASSEHVRILRDSRVAASPEVAQEERTCETCQGKGTIDERLGGYSFSNPKAKCPDCDGEGSWAPAVVATQEMTPGHPKTDREWLEALLEIWDDSAAPEEHRAYTPNAMRETLEDVRQFLAASPVSTQETVAGEPSLSDIDSMAKVYASNYASPHHITFTVNGLRELLKAAHPMESVEGDKL